MSDPQKANDVKLPTEVHEMGKLLERAERGDASTLPALQEVLAVPKLVDRFGDLAALAERSFVQAASGENLLFREALTRKLERLRQEVAGPNPTPVEQLLAERVVACWLQVQDADVRYAQAKDPGVKWATYCQDRMDRAHRRYLSALKTLATVRKLAVPVLQVNIARKQVNVAGSCAPPDAEPGYP